MKLLKYLVIFVSIFGIMGASTPEKPGPQEKVPHISMGDILTFGPSTVRLLCTFNLQALNWGTPLQGRYDQGFDIEYFRNGVWSKVGEILTQCKFGTEDDGSDLDFYGPHTRIRLIEINENSQNKGIGGIALKLLLSKFIEKSLPVKLEVPVQNIIAQHLFEKLNFVNVPEREDIGCGAQHWLRVATE